MSDVAGDPPSPSVLTDEQFAERIALRAAVESEWQKVRQELEALGNEVLPWPEDERLVRILPGDVSGAAWLQAPAGGSRAATFGLRVDAGPDMEARLRASMAGSAKLIDDLRRHWKAKPIVYVRVAPHLAPMLDGSVVVRCRIGFGQDPADEPAVIPASPAELARRECLTDAQLAAEEARVRGEG